MEEIIEVKQRRTTISDIRRNFIKRVFIRIPRKKSGIKEPRGSKAGGSTSKRKTVHIYEVSTNLYGNKYKGHIYEFRTVKSLLIGCIILHKGKRCRVIKEYGSNPKPRW